MSKEITGYKIKDEKYLKAAFEIMELENIEKFLGMAANMFVGSIAHKAIKEAGVLDLWFEPVYKEETALEVGKWYKIKGSEKAIVCFKSFGNFSDNFGLNLEAEWTHVFGFYRNELSNYEKATDKEVEEALIKEAKKRGFVEGVTIGNTENKCKGIIQLTCGFRYYNNKLTVTRVKDHEDNYTSSFCGNFTIFSDGQWAEIIEKPKNPEFTKEELKLIAKILKKI